MSLKILIYLILATTTQNINILAFECEFHAKGIETFDKSKLNAYGCELISIQSNNSITGNHISGKRESDVTFVYRYWGQNESMNLGSEFCQKFPNLKTIFIRNERILIIKNDAFVNCKNLEELQLFENEISDIPEYQQSEVFERPFSSNNNPTFSQSPPIKVRVYLLQTNVKLKTFAIESNKLTTIPHDLFSNAQKLEKLSLHNNQISSLPSDTFYDLINLKLLSLSKNKLKLIDPSWFSNLKNLEKLSLSENEISTLPEIIFESLASLKELYLTSNKIQKLNPNWFVNARKLEILGLDRNQITQINTNDLQLVPNLKGLYLNFNKIKELSHGCFENLQNLETLGLGWNEIIDLPRNIFSSLQKLKYLGLNNNLLSTIHEDSFGALQSLSSVYLGTNKINSIDEKFIDKTGVSKLDMEQNLCYNGWFFERTKMKDNLRKCFGNYKSRAGQVFEVVTASSRIPSITTAKTSGYEITKGSCGRPQVSVGNIVGGSKIKRGEYPWIAALLYSTGDYFCGGTLVSNRKVITAAHCIQEKQSPSRLYPKDLKVILGSFDLNAKFELGSKGVGIFNIHVHPEWNPQIEQYHADIAALVLAERIDYTSYIQPLCLNSEFNLAAIEDGIVVGYGKSEDESKLHENIPKVIKLPIHENTECFFNFPDLLKISSRKTFCAGSADGTGVCLGDSGGGLVVKYNNVYYLRGIVSSSLRDFKFGCDVNTYSVFTDVLKFYDWINGIDEFGDFYATRVNVESGPIWT